MGIGYWILDNHLSLGCGVNQYQYRISDYHHYWCTAAHGVYSRYSMTWLLTRRQRHGNSMIAPNLAFVHHLSRSASSPLFLPLSVSSSAVEFLPQNDTDYHRLLFLCLSFDSAQAKSVSCFSSYLRTKSAFILRLRHFGSAQCRAQDKSVSPHLGPVLSPKTTHL